MSKLIAELDKVTKHYSRFVLPKKGAVTGVLYVSKKMDIPASLTISLDDDTEITEKRASRKATKTEKRAVVTKKGHKSLKGNVKALSDGIAQSFNDFMGA